MNEQELIQMYKTFVEPHFLYALEVWGHSINSENDIINKLQSKILRIVFSCYRSADAWRLSNKQIKTVQELYKTVLQRTCVKHHTKKLPKYVSDNLMPTIKEKNMTTTTYETRSTKNNKFDYLYYSVKDRQTQFKQNCIRVWNDLPIITKEFHYSKFNC